MKVWVNIRVMNTVSVMNLHSVRVWKLYSVRVWVCLSGIRVRVKKEC